MEVGGGAESLITANLYMEIFETGAMRTLLHPRFTFYQDIMEYFSFKACNWQVVFAFNKKNTRNYKWAYTISLKFSFLYILI